MDPQLRLSLSDWPNAPLLHHSFRLSPNTARTLRNAQIQVEGILPISMGEFQITNNYFSNGSKEVFDLYQEDRRRRLKKVDILRGLREKIIKRQQHQRSTSSAKTCSSQKKSTVISQRSDGFKTVHQKHSSKKSSSPIFFRVDSHKKNNVRYSDYYCIANKQKKNTKRINTEDESTRSHRRQENTNTGQYYDSSPYKKRQRVKSPIFKETIIIAMNDLMKRWAELDEKHAKELSQLKNVTDIEKKRLLKIHKIEKEKLRIEMQNVKANITVKRKLSKHLV